MQPEQNKFSRGRGIYLLPNLFTLSALFFGFYAVIAAMKGLFEPAAIAVFVAMVMDTLDGRIARLTNTQTEFGAQLDSLSDLVSFGVAPAIILYASGLHRLGKAGWLITFVYVACVALRLARFNVQHNTLDKRYFRGLPCPTAAAVVVSLIWCLNEFELSSALMRILTAILAIVISALMVSNLRYYSFKDVDFKNKVPFIVILLVVLSLVLISVDPPLILFIASLAYALSAIPPCIYRLYLRRKYALKHKKVSA